MMATEPRPSVDMRDVCRKIRALPREGDGMTVGAIADAIGYSTGLVVSALEDIAEKEPSDG
jgi:hypothetical protein